MASATLLDSGSGLFQNISGSWYLIGLTNMVDQQGGASTTTFGDDSVTGAGKSDGNYFTRISSSDDKVLTLIPEPAPLALLAAGFGVILLARRKPAWPGRSRFGPSRS